MDVAIHSTTGCHRHYLLIFLHHLCLDPFIRNSYNFFFFFLMILYLVQHGFVNKEEEDPSRPLSEKGIKDVKAVSSYISRLNIELEEVLHSGKSRAKQTAEIMAENLRIYKGISETDGLAPLDDPTIWAERLNNKTNPTMLVGHMPHLGKLASLLLCGEKEKHPVAFKMGCIVCLKRDEKRWSLQWMVTPEILIS